MALKPIWNGIIFYGVTLWLSVSAQATVDDLRLELFDQRVLKGFTVIDDRNNSEQDIESLDHSLVRIHQFTDRQRNYARYQQYYKGILVLGRHVIAHFGTDKDEDLSNAEFSGKLARGLRLQIDDELKTDGFREEMLSFAKEDFAERTGINRDILESDSQPAIWLDRNRTAHFVYQVSFRVRPPDGPEKWPHYLIDAADSSIYQYWDNVKSLYRDKGPGGNEKTGRYVFGEGGLPSLSVTQSNDICLLANTRLVVISLKNRVYGVNNDFAMPLDYECDNNRGDKSNGAFSPANDAYVFGNMVIAMYERWYGQPILAGGQAVIVAVHAGINYENASWNGQQVLLGDGGKRFYPFASLGILAHEMSHAFTQQHSGLIGVGEAGAINEAFSDMAAIAAEYYLKSHNEKVHGRLYGQNQLTWQFGERISKSKNPIRSLSQPELYGAAGCYYRVAGCYLSYEDVDDGDIAHLGSGVISKAFYEMVKRLNGNVRKVFGVVLRANMLYWTPYSEFAEAACGVKLSASQEGVAESVVNEAFEAVGVTPAC